MSTDRPSAGGHGELLRQSLAAINSLEAEVERLRRDLESRQTADAEEPIAIVGAACRFPGGVTDLDSYWRLLENGTDAVKPLPPERRTLGGWESTEPCYAGLLDGIDQFDPRFFGISAREAITMDPQQRLVLEVGWEALENSGYAPGGLAGSSTGVFVGLSTSDYGQLIRESGNSPDVYVATGNAHNAAAGRLSFLLGLQGPSMAVDTACSSSLVAVHLACLSLRARNCRMALAGGVNVLLTEQPFQCFTAWGMMAPDGKCKTFDAAANGFVRSEGCGLVVLKRLSDAVADGDHIRAIVRGSAVNQDGRSSGLTVPNGPAQESVIRQALASARVEPAEIGYVEAHGTGTSLGDPIEAQALASVLGVGRRAEQPLVVGSVKTNLGHLESAAGVAGLIKVVLAFERERIPAHLHFQQINPQIEWAGRPVEIPSKAREWRRGSERRLAGISSFGFSGTNAHIILEEAPATTIQNAAVERPLHVLALSARTSEALDQVVGRMQDCWEGNPSSLPDISFTANCGRTHFRERLAVVAHDTRELREKLATGKVVKGIERQVRGKLAFLFTGQGSQWPGMGRELYDTQPVFREAMDECAGRLRLDRPLLDVIYGRDGTLLEQTVYTQPALFAVEWALAQLWKSWGIEPDVMLGHSVGEYAALCVAGVWSLEDGLRLITERGRLMQGLGSGWGMTALQSGAAQTEKAMEGLGAFISIAARNAPLSTVVSGRLKELAEIENHLKIAGIKSIRLAVSHGFHSRQMEEISQEFARMVGSVETREPRCRIVSSVTGRLTSRNELRDGEYWRRQVRNAVQFQAGMNTLAEAGYDLFVEIGPAPTLSGLGRQCIGSEGPLWLPSIRRERGAWDQILDSLAQLYVRGADVNWQSFDAPYSRHRVALPSYPFERQRYWVDQTRKRSAKKAGHPLLGTRVAVAGGPETYIWETEISTDALPYLQDHCVQGKLIFPGTGYIEMATAAAGEVYGDVPVAVNLIKFRKPLFLPANTSMRLQTNFCAVDGSVGIYGRKGNSGPWTLHAEAHVVPTAKPESPTRPNDFAARAERQMNQEEFYAFVHQRGNVWGPAFQGVRHVWMGIGEGWSEIEVPESIRGDVGRYFCHPAISDACCHALAAITPSGADHGGGGLVGQSIDRVSLYSRPRGTRLLTHAQLRPTSDLTLIRGDIRVYDEDGSLLSQLEGVQLRYLEPETAESVARYYQVTWREISFTADADSSASWLILGGESDALNEALLRVMRDSGVECRMLAESSPMLLRQALTSHGTTHVVSLRGMDAREPSTGSTAISRQSSGLLETMQVVAASEGPARLWVVTSGLEEVESIPDSDSVWQAPLRGLACSFSAEYPERWGGIVDLDSADNSEQNVAALWRYLQSPANEDRVALRRGRRFGARLEPFRDPEASALALRADCAYLITGGMGGLGLEVARWMISRGARRLILMGRTRLPDRSTWGELPPADRRSTQVRAIRELEAAGASVHLAFVDVGSELAVRQFLERYALECWPPIRGVVHAAGVLEHQLLADLTPDELDRSLRPKMGAWVLDRALEVESLDFFILFSSASALINSPRLGAYAAGNSFLDALARQRSSRGKPTLSINWGVWGETGMASHFEESRVRALAERGMGRLRTDEALAALECLIQQGTSQAAVLPIDFRKWAKLYQGSGSLPLLADLMHEKHENGVGLHERVSRKSSSCPNVVAYLADTLASVLGFDPSALDVQLPISDFGLDSLTALEFKNRIDSELGVKVPFVRFLQGPSLAALCSEIQPLIPSHARTDEPAEMADEIALLARLDALTDAEVEAALAGLLNEKDLLP